MNGDKQCCMICNDEIEGERILWKVDGGEEKAAHEQCVMRLANALALYRTELSLTRFIERLGDDAPKEMREALEKIKQRRKRLESRVNASIPYSLSMN